MKKDEEKGSLKIRLCGEGLLVLLHGGPKFGSQCPR